MAGFTAPKTYEPRPGWRRTLCDWSNEPAGGPGSWQQLISDYWGWRTVEGLFLLEAWKKLDMPRAAAIDALDRNSPDSGLIPPELFGRLLMRSQGSTTPEDNIADPI